MRETDEGNVPVHGYIRGRGQPKIEKKMQVPAYLKDTSISDDIISERDLNLIRSRLNSGRTKRSDIEIPDEGWKLTPDQTKKGYDFLINLWKSPTGKERVNNPFGYREQATLENFKEFRVVDFYDTANYYQNQMGMHFYVPYYRVVGMGDTPDFEYAYYAGKINIMG